MNTRADQTAKESNRAVANKFGENANRSAAPAQLLDQRPEALKQQALQELANSSLRAQRLAALSGIANSDRAEAVPKHRAPDVAAQGAGVPVQREVTAQHTATHKDVIQPKRKWKGVWIAESADEAAALMKAYAGKISMVWEEIPKRDRDIAVSVAQDSEQGGIDGAERVVFSVKQEVLDAKSRAERTTAVQEDFDQVYGSLNNGLALAAFETAHATYIGGHEVNAGIGGTYSQQQFYSAMREWEDAPNVEKIYNFHAFPPQDKEAQGKGNVGDTLDTRKVQGNLLCSFNGVKINVHVNIA